MARAGDLLEARLMAGYLDDVAVEQLRTLGGQARAEEELAAEEHHQKQMQRLNR